MVWAEKVFAPIRGEPARMACGAGSALWSWLQHLSSTHGDSLGDEADTFIIDDFRNNLDSQGDGADKEEEEHTEQMHEDRVAARPSAGAEAKEGGVEYALLEASSWPKPIQSYFLDRCKRDYIDEDDQAKNLESLFKRFKFEVGPANLWPWFRAFGAKSNWEFRKAPTSAQATGTRCLAPAAAPAGKSKRPKKKGASGSLAPRSRWVAASKRRMHSQLEDFECSIGDAIEEAVKKQPKALWPLLPRGCAPGIAQQPKYLPRADAQHHWLMASSTQSLLEAPLPSSSRTSTDRAFNTCRTLSKGTNDSTTCLTPSEGKSKPQNVRSPGAWVHLGRKTPWTFQKQSRCPTNPC